MAPSTEGAEDSLPVRTTATARHAPRRSGDGAAAALPLHPVCISSSEGALEEVLARRGLWAIAQQVA
jgi:hypothetical protein